MLCEKKYISLYVITYYIITYCNDFIFTRIIIADLKPLKRPKILIQTENKYNRPAFQFRRYMAYRYQPKL